MSSKLPEYVPPSPFTPFLRRFTDEIARDLSDTIALYERVRSAHAATHWGREDALERAHAALVDLICDTVELPNSAPVLDALERCQREVLALETTIFTSPSIDWHIAKLSLKEQVDLRRFLRAQEHFLANQDRIAELLFLAIGNVIGGVGQELPWVPDSVETATFTVPLVTLLEEPHSLVDRIIGTLYTEPLADAGLFTTLQDRFYENVCEASGVPPYEERRKPLITAADSDLPPIELVETYLKRTPFHDLLLCPLPFSLPQAVRFEHMHIVAGTGHGKTQTLQHLILRDLTLPPEDVPGLVIIDSQGDLLGKLARLDLFDPKHGPLKDRLVIIDPTDVEHPPALGLFDLNLARVRGYDARFAEQIMNGVIELYEFIFGGLLGAELTQKQNVIFRYLARLMLAIPDATIITLKDVMQDSAPFTHHFESLQGMAREFFQREFNDRQFAETKKQILRRLWGVLENPTFERLFSNPRNKLDMFEALNQGKIVLVNTAKDFLKSERSSILGRFFIALTFQAALERAAIPEGKRRPAFLYIDEAADYFDDTIDSLLTQARKFRLGVIFAHQYLDQLGHGLRASIMTNTSIKLAGGVSYADAQALAPNMNTTREVIGAARKRKRETEFSAFVRNVTPNAVTLTVPLGTLEREPIMSPMSFKRILVKNRQRFASSREAPRPVATDRVTPRQDPVGPARPEAEAQADDWRS